VLSRRTARFRTAHRVTRNSMLLSFGILAGATATTVVTQGALWDLKGPVVGVLGGLYAAVCLLALADILLGNEVKRAVKVDFNHLESTLADLSPKDPGELRKASSEELKAADELSRWGQEYPTPTFPPTKNKENQ
jgi:hypothetical protein